MTNMINQIPVIWEEPTHNRNGHLVIWLPGLWGSKEGVRSHLRLFANAGFTAISFDPWEHGERRQDSEEQFNRKINGNKRRYFWPIMARTTEDYPRIIDGAVQKFQLTGSVMAGGVSMGGDIAIAAAGLDRRIRAVAACISTPDWLRPGSDEPESEPDDHAWSCYHRYNPLTNLAKYAHKPAIRFLNGAQDQHVPPDGARRFRDALAAGDHARIDWIDIIEYEGIGHAMTEQMLQDALHWFKLHN